MQFETDTSKTANRAVTSAETLHQELRRRILALSGVTERENAGIHEDAFFLGGTMFMHIHGKGHCDIRLSKADQDRVLANGKAGPHRWAPEAGYVTYTVNEEEDLGPAMELIRMSHQHFSAERSVPRAKDNRSSIDNKHEAQTFRLLVIGATGRTGREVVQQALARGYQVRAYVRSPEGLDMKDERLTVVKGNVIDESQLSAAMQNQDAIISALGPREVFKPSTMLHDSALATIRAMRRSGVKRLVVLSAAAHFSGFANRIGGFVLRNHMRDSLAMEKIVQESGLDWTIARPPRLTQADSSRYRSREGAPPRMGFSVSRKAVAAFMLDTLEQKKHFQRIVGVAK